MNKPYVQFDDIHAFTDGKNIEVSSGKLCIITKRRKQKLYRGVQVLDLLKKNTTILLI